MTDRTEPSPSAVHDDLVAISRWVDPVVAPRPEELGDHPLAAVRDLAPAVSTWRRGLLIAAAAALLITGVAVVVRHRGGHETVDSGPTTPSTGAAPADGWTETTPAPLSARNQATAVWTGNEVIVFGGTTQPQCPLCDYAAYGDSLHDGAAYDPVTDTWRPIAPLPDSASYVGQAVNARGRVVWYLTLSHPDVTATTETYVLLAYSVADDTWAEVPVPGGARAGDRLAAFGDGIVLYPGSDEHGLSTDEYFEPGSGTWRALPDDPFDASFDRQYLEVDGSLLLFAKPIAGVSNSAQPTVTLAARLDPSLRQWQRLPDSDQLVAPVAADGAVAVAPFGGSADGGQVNNWGRDVPNGGAFDTTTDTWTRLPGDVPDDALGMIGRHTSWFGSVRGHVLDRRTEAWVAVPTLPDGLGDGFGQTIVAAGHDLFTFGGTTSANGAVPSAVHARSFVWRTGGEATPTTTTTSTTPAAITTTAPASSVPTGVPLTLQPRGGCSLAAFNAGNAANTVALLIYVDRGSAVGTDPQDLTYSLPAAGVTVRLVRGVNLQEHMCSDVIFESRIDSETAAVSGNLHLVITPHPDDPGGSQGCGTTDGTLTITGLTMADGTRLADLTITTPSIGCFPG